MAYHPAMSDGHASVRHETAVIHGGQRPEPVTGAVMPPIFTSSTYVQESPGVHAGFEYSRSHNPTRFALERMIAVLEGTGLTEEQDATRGGFAFASGLAAMATLLEVMDAGSRLVAGDDLYGGSNRLFSRVRERSQGLKVSYVDFTGSAWRNAITTDTAMVWVETPSNPMMKILDLRDIADHARSVNPGIILAADNTFASPVNQRPLELGFDVVMHSTTKYMNGHSDSVGGVLATNRADLAETLRFLQNSVGSVMSPFEAYLVLRGIKTLAVRIDRHNRNARRIAEWLEGHDMVERVVYPGLASHPQHAIAATQMHGFGGMITFFIRGGLENARTFLENVRLFALAESLGGVESLIEHPAIMTHASVPADQRDTLGISDTLIRLSVGIEHTDDLIADLQRAFAACGAKARA